MQLLWVNLIMDAMAALALATEPPSPKVLLDRPHGRSEPLISPRMWKHIVTQGLYQMFWLFLIVYGAPRLIDRYRLPSPALAFSNVDLHPLGGKAANLSAGGVDAAWRPAKPSPPGSEFEEMACVKGPCWNACCVTAPDGTCTDNLVSAGGNYNPGETPLCVATGTDKHGEPTARTNRPRDASVARTFCADAGGDTSCPRASLMKDVFVQADKQAHRHTEKARETYSSVVFNAFIFFQLFNEINARKIEDELNVFDGIWRSPGFLWVIVISIGCVRGRTAPTPTPTPTLNPKPQPQPRPQPPTRCQLVIMMTPLSRFFKVVPQDGKEWAFAVGVGAGALVCSLAVKLLTR